MKKLLPYFFAFIFLFFLFGPNLIACDPTPVITTQLVDDSTPGEYVVEIDLCVGNGGSYDGWTTTFASGIDIIDWTPTDQTTGGKVAAGSLTNGVLSYQYAGPNFPFIGFDLNTCFNYTVTVNGDPTGTDISFTGVNCESNQCPGSCAFVGGNTQTSSVDPGQTELFCDDDFTDGPGNYENNLMLSYLICSGDGTPVELEFTSFELENNYDFLTIYDSDDFTNEIASYTGTNSPGTLTSTNGTGCFTVEFTSDGSVRRDGWEAHINCCPDNDHDHICDVDDPDDDNDGCLDEEDDNPLVASIDSDDDGIADDCDDCPFDFDNDIDGDGICGDVDNCPAISNPFQEDNDNDGDGDVCDDDDDNDGCLDEEDDNPLLASIDSDNDGIADDCDDCPFDFDNDIDGDGICGDVDNCPAIANPFQEDNDNDGLGDNCDDCPFDFDNDIDGDGICSDVDNCPNHHNGIPPTALCQSATVQLDNTGNGTLQSNMVDNGSSDPCGITSIEVSPSDFDCDELGSQTATLTVTDVNNNTATCTASVSVEDNLAPTAACFNTTVNFNEEDEIFLSADQLWNEAASSDNCGVVNFVSSSLQSVTCDQVGATIPVTIVIEDTDGNTGQCVSNVTVSGLLCDFSIDPEGINCSGATGGYDPASNTYTLTSEGCYSPDHYRPTDSHGFLQTEFCGDGEISVQVTAVNGNGWAGISMRESNAAASKMIQLMLDGTNLTRREVRMSTGGVAFAHLFQTQGKNWLKISRTGNQFSAYHSLDGIGWQLVFHTTIAMPNCIEVGMITMNGAPTGEVTGVFSNVDLKNANTSLDRPIALEHVAVKSADHNLQVYPNPATNQTTISFITPNDAVADLEIYDSSGKRHYAQKVTTKAAEASQVQLSLQDLQPGLYFVMLKDGEQVLTKRLVVME